MKDLDDLAPWQVAAAGVAAVAAIWFYGWSTGMGWPKAIVHILASVAVGMLSDELRTRVDARVERMRARESRARRCHLPISTRKVLLANTKLTLDEFTHIEAAVWRIDKGTPSVGDEAVALAFLEIIEDNGMAITAELEPRDMRRLQRMGRMVKRRGRERARESEA